LHLERGNWDTLVPRSSGGLKCSRTATTSRLTRYYRSHPGSLCPLARGDIPLLAIALFNVAGRLKWSAGAVRISPHRTAPPSSPHDPVFLHPLLTRRRRRLAGIERALDADARQHGVATMLDDRQR